ncbi:hypothetical protein D3C71_1914640 [compost metagenome]
MVPVGTAPGAHGLGDQGHVAACLGDMQLVQQPVGHGGFAGEARVFNGAFQPLGIREAAHGQRGGCEPDEL